MSIARIGHIYPEYNSNLKEQRFTIIEQEYTEELKQAISTENDHISLINRAFENTITMQEIGILYELLGDMIKYYEDSKPSDEIIRQISIFRKSLPGHTTRHSIIADTIINIYNHFNLHTK